MANIVRAVFVVLTMLAGAGYLYYAAQIMKIRGEWAKVVRSLEKDLSAQLATNALLADGDLAAQKLMLYPDEIAPLAEQRAGATLGVRQLQIALQHELVDRGRVWDDCTRVEQPNDTGALRVRIRAPLPTGLAPKMLVQVFERADITDANALTGGAYLGEFKVETVDDAGAVALAPAQRLTPRKLAQLQRSQQALALYELMPNDRVSSFVNRPADELKRLIPENYLEEYAQVGQAAADDTPDTRLSRVWVPNRDNGGAWDLIGPKPDDLDLVPADPKAKGPDIKFAENRAKAGNYDLMTGKLVGGQFQAGKFYQRSLRDYETLFRRELQQIWHLDDVSRTLDTTVKRYTASVEGMQGQQGALPLVAKQIETLETEKKRSAAEAELTKRVAAEKEAEVEQLRTEIAMILADVQRQAAEYTAAQLEAAARIDQRSERAAR